MGSNDFRIRKKLKNVFGHDEFKTDIQKNAVEAVYTRESDVFITMPTGAGKSLCYQLPAVLHEDKVAIVFSPLLALIKDQLDHLKDLKIPALSINSDMSSANRTKALNDLRSKKIETRLLYVTPEQADTNQFKCLMASIHRHNKISFIVVDEAHCVCQWGRDFRPSYLRLGALRKEFMDVPWVALTATADAEVKEDIIKTLHLKKPVTTFRTPCFRPNLFYDVVFKETMIDPYVDLKNFILKCLGEETESKPSDRGCGIVYCKTRLETATVADELSIRKIPAVAYNSGMSTKERTQAQNDWMGGVFPVIAATIGFGMGVDKASVRFVAHWTMSQSISAYYQESGRAGRDGKPAFCRIYHSKRDRDRLSYNINQGSSGYEGKQKEVPEEVKAHNYKKFVKLVEYCELPKCRHRVFADHFGDSPPECKGKCDVCKDPAAVETSLREFVEKQDKRSGIQEVGDSRDLYGGGRDGQAREASEYASEGDREERAAKEAQEFILSKLAARRPDNPTLKQDQAALARSARVKAAESTVVKYNGLTIPIRENRLQAVIDMLKENYTTCGASSSVIFTSADLEACGIDAEYQLFTANHVTSVYRMAVGKMLRDIKHSTTKMNLDERLKSFLPGRSKYGTLSDAFKEITSIRETAPRGSEDGDCALSSCSDSGVDETKRNTEDTVPAVGFKTHRKAHTKTSDSKHDRMEIISASTLLARMKTEENFKSSTKIVAPVTVSDLIASIPSYDKKVLPSREAAESKESVKVNTIISAREFMAMSSNKTKVQAVASVTSKKNDKSQEVFRAENLLKKKKTSNSNTKPNQQTTLFSFGIKKKSLPIENNKLQNELEESEKDASISSVSTTANVVETHDKLSKASHSNDRVKVNTHKEMDNRKRKSEGGHSKPNSDSSLPSNKKPRTSKPDESKSNKSKSDSRKPPIKSSSSAGKLEKQKVADLVVRNLMHYFKKGDEKQMIPSSELFKLIAKKLTRPFLDGLLVPDESVVKLQVSDYFKNHGVIKSEADI